MAIEAKICGINDAAAMEAAAEGGAAYIGLNFYPPSPRAVSAGKAGELAALAGEALKVGLFVDPDDALLEATLAAVPLDIIQLHGQESPARVAAIRRRFTLPVMKAIKLAAADDLAEAGRQQEIADRLLFDAKAPKERTGALPGGNALAFDWRLLAGKRWERPWMLSGGLTAGNLAEAVAVTGAKAVDVSSGVEVAPGRKDPKKIAEFLELAARL